MKTIQELYEARPWLRMAANTPVLESAFDGVDYAATADRLGDSLAIHPAWLDAYREHLSIHCEAEDNLAERQLFFERKKAADEVGERGEIIRALREKVQAPGSTKDGAKPFSFADVHMRHAVLELMTLEELRAAHAQMLEQRRLKQTSATEIAKEIRQANPGRQKFELLPEAIEFYGTTVKLDSAGIIRLSNEQLRYLSSRYGFDQINSRLRGEK